MSTTTSAEGVTWDLSNLYQGHDDPQIATDLDRTVSDAETFAATYRGTIAVPGGPAPLELRRALERIETIYDQLGRIQVFAHLLFAADTSAPENRDLLQKIDQRATAVYNTLLFFELEWLEVSDADAERLVAAPDLETYRHYLWSARRLKPHTLSEPEERMVNEKDQTGSQSWQRLFTELTSSLIFPVEQNGETRTLDLDSVLALLYRPDRKLRRQAFETLYATLQKEAEVRAYVYNTLLQDQITMNRLRRYDDPMMARHLSNHMDPAAVATMMEVVEQNYDIAHSYYALKARLLDLPRLQLYDQYAPVTETTSTRTFSEAQQLILKAMEQFHPQFRDIGAAFFIKQRIDAELRPGKRGGAFCSGYPTSNVSFILCNYNDDIRDVMTVAHELGHGIHFDLARKQTLFNFIPVLPMAETASVFAEMLVFEHLIEQEQDRTARLGLACRKIEDIFATTFRQNVLTRFEQAAYAGRDAGRMTPDQLNAHWLAANRPYYGDAVELSAGYEYGWSYIPHFIQMPFYCYSYVFGELLVLALYATYREQGKTFVPQYIGLLEAGGSRNPIEMLSEIGVDIRDAAFWQRGLNELRRLVGWAQELAT